MGQAYLIRYGLMRHVGRFATEGIAPGRGETVVVRSERGTELGEVLAQATIEGPLPSRQVLRVAGGDDLERAERADAERLSRVRAAEAIFRDGVWPIELIDAEILLDGRTVVYYLGSHGLDAGLGESLRDRFGLDAVMLEPVGRDLPDDPPPAADDDHGCGSCGSGTGTGGGCGSEGGGCGTGGGGGCSGCAVKDLVRGRATP